MSGFAGTSPSHPPARYRSVTARHRPFVSNPFADAGTTPAQHENYRRFEESLESIRTTKRSYLPRGD